MTTTRSLLSDDIIRLRALEFSDLDLLYTIENDTSLWRNGVANTPFSRNALERYIRSASADVFTDEQLRLTVIEISSGDPVGFVDLFEFDHLNRRAGVGIVIAPDKRRNGYGVRALNLLAEYSGSRLGLHQLWAVTASGNTASRALFASAGFHTCGSLRSWLRISASSYEDALMWQRLL